MIGGIGVDLVDPRRFRGWNEGKCRRFFSEEEVAELDERFHPLFPVGVHAAESFAVRYAVREALGKAWGCGLAGFASTEVSVVKNTAGKPAIRLKGKAAEIHRERGNGKIHLSLSHEKESVIAFVIIEEGHE